jgi:hypothetical protein
VWQPCYEPAEDVPDKVVVAAERIIDEQVSVVLLLLLIPAKLWVALCERFISVCLRGPLLETIHKEGIY